MIQRIQTVYFLIAIIAVAIMFFVPLARISGYQDEFLLDAGGIYKSSGEMVRKNFIIPIALITELVFALVIIFQFKKRNRQMLMAKLNLLMLTIIIALVFFSADYAKEITGLPEDTLVSYQFACLLPVVSIILNYLAIRAIKKDEELVRAADRLR